MNSFTCQSICYSIKSLPNKLCSQSETLLHWTSSSAVPVFPNFCLLIGLLLNLSLLISFLKILLNYLSSVFNYCQVKKNLWLTCFTVWALHSQWGQISIIGAHRYTTFGTLSNTPMLRVSFRQNRKHDQHFCTGKGWALGERIIVYKT